MDQHEILKGGNSNQVIREENTVVRKTGVWSPFVHALLRHLQQSDFKEAPVLIEATADQERLTYIEGEVGNYPLKPYMQSEEVLIEAARLLRRFHDITLDLAKQSANTSGEVICHNDFAPYNCVFQSEHLVGIIDFDTAAPGSRVWDIAYAVYRFVPLTNDPHSLDCGWSPVPDRLARLKLFCEAYGMALEDRAKLMDTVQERLRSLVAYMEKNAANLEHIPLYMDDLEYIADHQALFTAAITE